MTVTSNHYILSYLEIRTAFGDAIYERLSITLLREKQLVYAELMSFTGYKVGNRGAAFVESHSHSDALASLIALV